MSIWKTNESQTSGTQTSTTSRPLDLLHLDLMGPTRMESLGGKSYIMILVDDFTRYTWVIPLWSKFDASEHIETLCTRLQNEKSLKNDQIQSDHGKEFENSYMESFCTRSGISQEFSTPITSHLISMEEIILLYHLAPPIQLIKRDIMVLDGFHY